MKYIKIFEAYFDKSSNDLFESMTQQDLEKFSSSHMLEIITENDLLKISNLFKLEFKLNDNGKTAYNRLDSKYLSKIEKLYPRVIAKYEDDWWILIIYDYKKLSHGNKILCDGIEGIEDFAKSIKLNYQ